MNWLSFMNVGICWMAVRESGRLEKKKERKKERGKKNPEAMEENGHRKQYFMNNRWWMTEPSALKMLMTMVMRIMPYPRILLPWRIIFRVKKKRAVLSSIALIHSSSIICPHQLANSTSRALFAFSRRRYFCVGDARNAATRAPARFHRRSFPRSVKRYFT